ncbi:hypothetical protein ACFQZC_19670 [Streptacidiphilus monticola]
MSDRQGGGEMELVQDPEEILARAPEGAEDIADELAAPPRRKLPWLTLVLAAGVIAAGGFIGGVEVQKSQGGGSATAPGVGAFRTGAGVLPPAVPASPGEARARAPARALWAAAVRTPWGR